jgi:uncharacterized protein
VRVFLDTSVLVSAYATRGLCADVLRLILTEHELLTAEVVLVELERILSTKIRLPPDVVEDVVSFLREHPVEPMPFRLLDVTVGDPDDAVVLASAVSAGADVLISGAPDLLSVAGEVTALRITNPRGFWQMHRPGRKP